MREVRSREQTRIKAPDRKTDRRRAFNRGRLRHPWFSVQWSLSRGRRLQMEKHGFLG